MRQRFLIVHCLPHHHPKVPQARLCHKCLNRRLHYCHLKIVSNMTACKNGAVSYNHTREIGHVWTLRPKKIGRCNLEIHIQATAAHILDESIKYWHRQPILPSCKQNSGKDRRLSIGIPKSLFYNIPNLLYSHNDVLIILPLLGRM